MLCFEATVFGGGLKGKPVCYELCQHSILYAIYCPLLEIGAHVVKLVMFAFYYKEVKTRKSCFNVDHGIISILP